MKALLARALSRLARPVTQDRIGVYNGVAARDTPLFAGGDHYPDHKRALCDAIADTVTSGDDVVLVGGGRGVAAVWAARQGASVTVYEAASEMVDTLAETVALNEVNLTINHAVVGRTNDVYGNSKSANRIPPSDLDGDVLVLDCEGAELDILPTKAFASVVVETHPQFGAPTNDVLDRLPGGEIVAPDPIDGDVVVA